MINVYNYLPNYQQGLKKTLKFGLELDDFLVLVFREFGLPPWQKICLVTTDRTAVNHVNFKELQDNSTLYLLQSKDQDLPVAAEEDINFVPHYNTLIESGTFEYFAEGQKSLPCSLAELVDNSLSATAKNTGVRTIEIRLLFDKTFAVVVLDNGCGMTSKQLNNWAVYRLSKFTRENSTFESEREGYTRPEPVRRSLNSDISYFGVGGKQAAFHIGNSVRMITKPRNSPDVHELVLSKDEFEKKEKNKEDVYKGTILNRKPGDFSHITHEERYLQDIIKEETRKESFTAVVITGVCPDHIKYLKDDFHEWTRRLAHIYHYYIHGVDGNHKMDQSQKSDVSPKIDILVTLREKPPKGLRQKNLREVQDDLQTLYINSAVDTFEFKATTSDGGSLDGILRYHPFLYDKETYPKDPSALQALVEEDDDENQSGTMNQARGKRDIFECFWNGRLIPYTTISEFDWCCRPAKSTLPLECFSRFSGVLFTNDKFRVNASKQKFMDLELKLRHRDTLFTPVFNVQKASKNRSIQKDFIQWLENCHSQFDKQVKFLGYSKTVTRTDVPTKKMQHPWAVYSAIELDGKTYKAGDLVKSQKTQPIYYGKVNKFFLYGYHEGNVFATGGEVEITRMPEALYDSYTRTIPISKIDRSATIESIKRNIETDIDKLPEKLCVRWPEENALPQNAVIPAGTPLGPLAVEILNRNDKSISSRIQTGVQGGGIKLNVGLKIFLQGAKEVKQPKQICHFRAPYVPGHGHWFKKIGSLTNLGNYTLTLQAEVSDNANNKAITSYGGRQLPSYEHKFTVKEGNAENFTIGPLNPSLRIGVPFSIPTQMTDIYGHPTKPPPNLQPVLECSDLEVSFETTATSGNSFTIKGVKVIGEVQNYQQTKRFDLNVTLPGLKKQTQTIKISPFPGNPHSLLVKPEVKPVKVENGNPVSFNVEVHDEAGNITANAKQIVRCQIPGLKLAVTDCSSSGTGQIVTEPINLKIINGEPQMLQAKFDMPSQKHVVAVTTELKVMPSCRVSRMELFCEGEERLELKNKERIQWQAGGMLENLFFKLYDESGKEVEVTPEIASNIKVNWTGDIDQRALIMGRLPDVQVPTKVQEERFHQVSYRDHSVSFSFTIVPCPDEPARLKATVPENTVKLGECVTAPIKLKLVDQYDNVTNSLTSACVTSMAVEAEGLDKSNIAFIWEESSGSIKVSGVRFNSGPLGTREVCFICGDYTEQINFKVTAGIPTKLKLLSGPEMPLQILNGTGISTPFVVQLCDEWGNPSPDQRVVVETRASPSTVKVTTSVTSQPVDAEGKAAFKVTNVKGLKGYYQLEFVGCFNRKPISGPHVNFNIIPDPNKPDKLSVNYDTSARFLAGGTFPVFSVAVLSDAGSAMTAFKSADLSMWYWSGESMTRPETATMLMCSKPMENDNKSRYYFRDKKIPQSVGTYTIQFSLKIEKTEVVFSNQIIVNVVANQPVKLGPECQPQIPVVSYSRDIANRTLVENMTLKIMDQYGNPTGQNLNGKVLVSIKCPDGEQSRNLPVLEVASTVELNLKDGSTHIERLAIREKSPGENGRKYILIFKPEVVMSPTSLSPFELPFHFYDDSESQRKVSELTKKKDELTDNYEKLNNKCTVLARLRELHTKNVLDANKKEEALKRGLEESKIQVLQPSSIQNIDSLLQQNADEKKTIEDINRRVFPLPNRSGPDILGMVGHLAHISNDKAAWVISWHLSSEMDCVITKTTAEAQRIFRSEHGRQQVMALDSIYVHPRREGPLPHIKNGRELFSPVGNPLYARNLLIYTTEEESCERVFKNILGNTILMDDIESATNYRKAVIEKGNYCPTILTRDGNRLSASGKFGGAQNKAPHEDRVKRFGAPLPQRYYDLQKERELLIQYRSALEKKKDENDKRNTTILKLSETRQQMEETKAELDEIERRLASVRSGKRGPEDISDPSGLMIKRPRRRTGDLPETF